MCICEPVSSSSSGLAWLLGRVSFIAASGRYVLLQHRLVLVLSWLFNYGYGLSHVAVDR